MLISHCTRLSSTFMSSGSGQRDAITVDARRNSCRYSQSCLTYSRKTDRGSVPAANSFRYGWSRIARQIGAAVAARRFEGRSAISVVIVSAPRQVVVRKRLRGVVRLGDQLVLGHPV